MKLFSIGYAGSDLLRLTSPCWQRIEAFVCSKCRFLRAGSRAIHVDVRSGFEPARLNSVSGLEIGVIRNDFASVVDAGRYLLLGSVSVDGMLSADFKTYRSDRKLLIRGDAKSTCWRCDVCQHIVYFPCGDNRYVLAQDVTFDAIFESELGTLVIPEGLLPPAFAGEDDLQIEEIAVRYSASDGQCDDLNAMWIDPLRRGQIVERRFGVGGWKVWS